jgi:sugar lactone lactonase YvrE
MVAALSQQHYISGELMDFVEEEVPMRKMRPQRFLLLALIGLCACERKPPAPEVQDLAGVQDLATAPDLATPRDAAAPEVTVTRGFSAPESVFWDMAGGVFYVSNVAGDPSMKDGQGWISRLDVRGRVVEEKWVMGLNAPKGIRVAGGVLYVADVDRLVRVQVLNKMMLPPIPAPGAMFLNDVAVGADGTVYVTDTSTNSVYRWKNGMDQMERLVQDDRLNGVNGVLVDGNQLVLVSSGPLDMPMNQGAIWKLDLESKMLQTFGTYKAKMDGVEKDGMDLLVTDHPNATLVRVTPDGNGTVVHDFKADGLMSAADLGFNPATRTVAVPDLRGDSVAFLRLPRVGPAEKRSP